MDLALTHRARFFAAWEDLPRLKETYELKAQWTVCYWTYPGLLQLEEPSGVAISPTSGEIYVTDSHQNNIFVFTETGEFLRHFGTKFGVHDGDLRLPQECVFNLSNDLAVVDNGNGRVQIFNQEGQFLFKFGAHTNKPHLSNPYGITINDEGNYFVSDLEPSHVIMYNPKGVYIQKFAAPFPVGVAVDVWGNLIVSELKGCRIQVFNPKGEEILTFGSRGNKPLQFQAPSGIAVDMDGSMIVADASNNRVQICSKTGEFLRFLGPPGIPKMKKFNHPEAVAIMKDGSIVVADKINKRIVVFG